MQQIYRKTQVALQLYFLNSISDMLDYYSNYYEYKVIFGDFNMNPVKPEMNAFLNTDNRTNLISSCYRTLPSAIWEIFSEFLRILQFISRAFRRVK